MEICIRPYQKEDCVFLLPIINDAIMNTTILYDYNCRTLADQQQNFDNLLQKGFPVLVATFQEEVVGFGYFGDFRFREAYKFSVEHSLYAKSNFIGKGVGNALLTALIEEAKIQNRHTMIGVIDSENTNSILFHEKFGFEKVGYIKESGFKFNKWLDSVFMQKIL